MEYTKLWQNCTADESKKLILSLHLLGDKSSSDNEQLACLYAVSNTISQHYYSRSIAKAHGGSRQLKVPDPLLMGIQRNILHNCLMSMPVSAQAMAYQQGRSVRSNGAAHVGQPQVLNLDIRGFFDSIDQAMVYRWAFPGEYYPLAVRGLLTNLCCYKGRLPQGAPTSPAISNLVMRDFDETIASWCSKQDIAYTRYCDDMTFSGAFDAQAVKALVKAMLYKKGMTLNPQKTRLASKDQRQLVTGVVVNAKVQTARPYRRKLRQTLYYCQQRGIAEHLRYIGDEQYLPLGEAGIRRYAHILLGKVNYVLHMAPEDQAFRQAAQWLKETIAAL